MRTPKKPGTIKRSRQLRRDATKAEGLLWWKLREANTHGYHFRRQVPIRGYFLDFAEHSARLAIELDGSQHGIDEHIARDETRDRVLVNEGYAVLRFWNYEVIDDLDRVVDTVLRKAASRRPPPERATARSTSPQGGGY